MPNFIKVDDAKKLSDAAQARLDYAALAEMNERVNKTRVLLDKQIRADIDDGKRVTYFYARDHFEMRRVMESFPGFEVIKTEPDEDPSTHLRVTVTW